MLFSKASRREARADSVMPLASMVWWAMCVSARKWRSISSPASAAIMPSVSKGTPGMAMSTLPASSNHIMGAVPKRFCITRQLVGTRAWSAVSGFMVSPRRLNTRRMFSVTAGSRRSSPPKRSVSTVLVRSSLVGPRPPVVITSCESAMHMLMAWRMSAGSSPTVSTRFNFQPSGPRVRAMKPELVSVT